MTLAGELDVAVAGLTRALAWHLGWLPGRLDESPYQRAVERIVSMAETQGEHWRGLERTTLDAQIALAHGNLDERRLGQRYGFAIGALAITVGGVAVVLGHDIASSLFGLSSTACYRMTNPTTSFE